MYGAGLTVPVFLSHCVRERVITHSLGTLSFFYTRELAVLHSRFALYVAHTGQLRHSSTLLPIQLAP